MKCLLAAPHVDTNVAVTVTVSLGLGGPEAAGGVMFLAGGY
jgi:hypothetical protein